MSNVIPLDRGRRLLSPAEAAGVREALTMIDPRWGLRLVICQEVLRRQVADHPRLTSPRGGALLSTRAWGEAMGKKSDRHLRELIGPQPLKEGRPRSGVMWRDEHVILLGDRGTGRRPTEYFINPEIGNWWKVPWLVEVELREYRVDAARRAAGRGAKASVGPRWGAEQSIVVPPSSAELRAVLLSLRRDDTPDLAAFPASSSAPGRGATEPDGSSTARGDGVGACAAGAAPALHGDEPGPSSASAEKRKVELGSIVLTEALERKTARPCRGKSLQADIRRLVTQAPDVDELVRAVELAPGDLQGPLLVNEHLPLVLAGIIVPEEPPPVDDWDGDRLADRLRPKTEAELELKITEVEESIDIWRSSTGEEPHVLIEQLAGWQDELHHRRRAKEA